MRSPFPQKPPANKKSSEALPIVQVLILGLVITILAAVIVQNLQPLVQIVFLGQKTLPIPLSLAMLAAFVVGGLMALVLNAIASYQQNLVMRRAIAAANIPEQVEPKEPNTFSSNYQAPKSASSTNSPSSVKKEEISAPVDEEDYEDDDEYEDDWEEEDDDWEDEEEYEDDDPDTVPYGDRKNLKSAKPNREKRDRPPLDARYIR